MIDRGQCRLVQSITVPALMVFNQLFRCSVGAELCLCPYL
jgi:hypothetical protein